MNIKTAIRLVALCLGATSALFAYPVSAQYLTAGNSVALSGQQTIQLDGDGRRVISSNMQQRVCMVQRSGGGGPNDPLILDLNNNGLSLTNVNTRAVQWDLNMDTAVDDVAWVDAPDGLLAFDRNKDGEIDAQSELFGTMTTSGFTILADLDVNQDGKINGDDPNFGDLLVWVDANFDGRSRTQELQTLSDYSITEISLMETSTAVNSVPLLINGNAVPSSAEFIMNGQKHKIYMVYFQANFGVPPPI